MLVVIGLVLAFYLTYRLYQGFCSSPNIDPKNKYVLISGCDSGFGHELAIELDKQGFHVLAGIYIPDNQISLTNTLSSRATVFHLDITRQADIDAAYEMIKKKTNTLHALVNNAGAMTIGYIDWTSMESIRTIMEINFFGHVAMTKKFLPLLITKRDSRVVNTCSILGCITIPAAMSYCASKYALESFSDCLRREMASWGLRVSIIEPGSMKTKFLNGHERSLRDMWAELSSEVTERWGEDSVKHQISVMTTGPFIKTADNPQKVVQALQHAVMSTAPCIRYRPGWQSNLILFPLSMAPAWLIDPLLIATGNSRVTPPSVKKQIKN